MSGMAPGLADGKGGLAGAGGVDGALLLLLAAALMRSGYQLHGLGGYIGYTGIGVGECRVCGVLACMSYDIIF